MSGTRKKIIIPDCSREIDDHSQALATVNAWICQCSRAGILFPSLLFRVFRGKKTELEEDRYV